VPGIGRAESGATLGAAIAPGGDRASSHAARGAEVAAVLAAIGEADDPRLMEMAERAGADVDEDAAVAMAARLRRAGRRWMPNQATMERRRGPAEDRRYRHGVARR
jgi:hypothetical protein